MPNTPAARTLARHTLSRLGWALGLTLAAATAHAGGSPAARGGLDSDDPSSRVVLADASRDTLDYERRDAIPAAIEALASDGWTIQRADTLSGRIVTHWKPLKHVLARLLLGQVMARCVVDLVPLGDGRTQITIQGGLASAQDLALNPSYGAAKAIYHGATVKWIGNVRHALDERARQGLVARVEPPRERGPVHESN